MEAGIDDVAIGALFGLYDWKFEVMGLLHHALDLERQFGIGPHTVSFPRMQPAPGSFLSENSPYLVSNDAMRRVVAVLRLAIPYSGLIVTAREEPNLKRDLLTHFGCTQRRFFKIGYRGLRQKIETGGEYRESPIYVG